MKCNMLVRIGQNKHSNKNLYLQCQHWNSLEISAKEIDNILYKSVKK